jgi:glycine cleavage system H protein
MSHETPESLRYTKDHEWTRDNGDGTVTVGITDYAQDALGDVTYVELPDVGSAVNAGDTFGVVESVKTFSDLYAPVSGEVTAINDAVVDAPETINESAYGDGWLLTIKVSDASEMDALMDAGAYNAFVEAND